MGINVWVTSVIAALGLLIASRRQMHFFQLESYQFQGYFRTLRRQWKKAQMPCFVLALVVLCAQVLGGNWLAAIFMLLGGILIRYLAVKQNEKKKFVLTARMKRLYLIHVALLLLLCLAFSKLSYAIMAVLLPLVVAASALLAWPVERFIFYLYFHDAEKMLLANDKLIRIGITGSYGKTSVKFILNTILSQKYNVLCTPSSFNTPMGVTRIVRERLEPSHQIFIGEMGARHVGEIKELCRLVHPSIGILTAVGPQHLDTFRTIDRIKKTKYELIEALPADGFAVFNNDDAIVAELHARTAMDKALVGKENGDAWASNVTLSPQGSSFMLHLKGAEPIACTTTLLGEHNIQNILMCAVVAQHLGLTAQQIARGIAQLKPVEHRLQLLRSAGGVTVIDDAFNTNPRSSTIALDVLRRFPGRRIIVTPGMVELGEDEEKYNRIFGEKMAACADLVFLVGKKHTKPILDGLLSQGFDQDKVYVTSSLDEATRILNPMMQSGDVILYENDLPDNYSET